MENSQASENTSKLKGGKLEALKQGFQSLRVRNYRLFIFGQAVSQTGTWMQTTAEAWLVLQLAKSPFASGLVVTLEFLPVTILSLFGGVLADRLPKRKTLIVTQAAFLIQAAIFGILVATNLIQIWHIYVLAVVLGTITAIDTPVRQAFVVEMVGKEDIVNAVALNSMTINAARVVGPSIAGIIIAEFGFAPALLLNAVSYVAVIIALWMMSEQALFVVPKVISTTPALRQLHEGLLYTLHTPTILATMIVIAAIGTFGYNFTVLLPLIAEFVLHTNAEGLGLLSAAFGIGSLIAAAGTAYMRKVNMTRMLIGATAFSFILAALSVTSVFALSALLLAGLGIAGMTFATSANSLLQLSVPDELRGRVMSLWVLLMMGSTPVGALLIGTMSEHLGVPAAIFTCAVLCFAGVVAAMFYRRSHRHTHPRAELQPSPAPSGD